METFKSAPYVELPVFQGPLDLLLHLIRQNKVDIYDIPIALIADQFIRTVKRMEELDMEVTSEFLVLAAQLLYLKSRHLLPRPQKTEEDIEMEEEMKQNLIDRLVTYQAFKEVACYLSSKVESSGHKYFRDVNLEEIMSWMDSPNPLQGVSMDDLKRAFQTVLSKVEKGVDVQHIKPEGISLEVVTKDIIRRMLIHPQGLKFTQLLRRQTRIEIVVVFLSILELLKEGKIKAEQSSQGSDIFLIPTEKAWEFSNEVLV
ncbi:MAG: segregation/condensation protein A [Peptococcaceae bacterium]|nr:segregation/condensation protein A [Peptococcaceae bacterium]